MLTIRDAQMDVFEAQRRERFEARALRYLAATPPGVDEATGRALVRAAWEMAARYGVDSEYDVLRLVGLCRIFGPAFDTDPARPWVRGVLADPARRAAVRVQTLWARLRAEA